MSDSVFSPFPAPASVPVPGSAEVVYLRRALFVIKGTFFNPSSDRDEPLPPHRWVLTHSLEAFSEGTTSDERGISTVFDPAVVDGVGPDDTWDLLLVPMYPGKADSDVYAEHREAWIDVENAEWVPGDEVRVGTDDDPYALVTQRKLLRIPLWSTRRKARMGGGFKQPNPHAPAFATTGLLHTSELKPLGSRDTPWTMQVDHGLFRTHVQLRFYDYVAKAERSVPQGLLLLAINEISSRVMGGSSVRRPDGSIYVLHGVSKDAAGLVAYRFETPRNTQFDLESDAMESTARVDLERLATHHFLPPRWTSVGLEAWVGARDASADIRKPFSELRLEGETSSQPVCFHLDDLALVHEDFRPVSLASDRICLLDHNMAIRDPDKNDEGVIPWSKVRITKNPMRAEEFVFVRGKGIEASTRMIDYEGRLFEVSHRHTAGGKAQSHVGVRAAFLPERVRHNSRYDLHLVETRYIRHDYHGTNVKLAHLVVYVPCIVIAPDEDTQNGKNEAKSEGLDILRHMLIRAAQVWDQSHPAHPEHFGRDGARKRYAIVPKSGVSEDTTIVLVRHHFGLRTSEHRLARDPVDDPDDAYEVFLHPQAGRATAGDEMHLYLKFTNKIKPPPTDPHADVERPYYFEPRGTTFIDRIDEVREKRFMFAHELGHTIGFPDEYMESLHIDDDLEGTLPQFDDARRPRQFSADFVSMMESDYAPRLRYAWWHMAALRAYIDVILDPTHFLRTQGPIVPHYKAPSHDLRFDIPEKDPRFSNVDPWRSPIDDRVGECTVFLFHLGDDESSRGPMVTHPDAGIVSKPFDGVVVVTCNFWFQFLPSVGDLEDQWEVMYEDFGRAYYRREDAPQFFIEAPAGAADLRRVLVLVRPRFEHAGHPSDVGGTKQSVSNADVEVIVRGDQGRKRFVNRTARPVVKIRDKTVGHWLMRFAIDPAGNESSRKNRPLRAADLEPINRWLAHKLGRQLGTVKEIS